MLSDYEKLRLSNIARNEAKLKSLNLDGSFMSKELGASKKKKMAAKKRKSEKQIDSKVVVVRRKSSRRLAGVKVNYKEEKIISANPEKTFASGYSGSDLFNLPPLPDDNNEDDNDGELKRRRPPPNGKSIEEKSADLLSSIASHVAAMKSVKPPADEKKYITSLIKSCKNDKAEAVRLWGLGCVDINADGYEGDEFWSKYVTSRRASDENRLSPYAFLQEVFQHDGWKLLCACALMSRVSSHETKERCLGEFFSLCPTPTTFLSVDNSKLLKAIHSLGMQESRVKSLIAITEQWLGNTSENPEFKVDLIDVKKGGNKIYGCGAFTVDSFNLFFRGDSDYKMASDDRCCTAYKAWLKKEVNSPNKEANK